MWLVRAVMNRWDRVPQNKKELVSAMKNDMFDPISSIYHVLLLSKGNGIEADEHIQVDGNRGRLHPAVCVHYRNRAVIALYHSDLQIWRFQEIRTRSHIQSLLCGLRL